MSYINKDWEVEGFWKGDDYKKVVQRVEDGFQFCSELSRLVQERAQIETKYASKLQAWSAKWTEIIEKGKCSNESIKYLLSFL